MGNYNRISTKFFIISSIGIIFSSFLTNTSAAVINNIQNSEVTKKCPDQNCEELYSELSKRTNERLNKNVSPCDNIQEFVCGNSSYSSFSKEWDFLYNDMLHKNLEMLGSRISDFVDFKPFKLLNDLYKTCMRYENTGQQSLDLLRDIIKKLGNWPLLEENNWKESHFDWIDFVIKTHNIGFKSFYFLNVWEWKYQDESITFELLPIRPDNLSHENPTLNISIAAYKNYIAKVSELLGNTQRSSEEIDEIIAFEIDILKFDSGREFIELRYDEFIKNYPSTNLRKLLNYITVYDNEIPSLSNSTIITIKDFPDFVELMKKTPIRVQANYGVWKIIQETIPYLTDEYRELKREYCSTQNCEIEIRKDSCKKIINRYLPLARDALYEKNLDNDIDRIITEMTVNIKEQFVNLINESTWINKKIKNQGIEQLENITVVIGYEGKYTNEIVKYYENLEIDTSNYLQTLINLELFDRRSNNNRDFNEIIARSHPTSSSDHNHRGVLSVPMSMLRSSHFSVNNPMYVNYGRIGKAIAEKLAESIIVMGEKLTEGINLTAINYEKTLCFRQQVENYTSNNAKNSWKEWLSSSERISEHIVYKATYRAYQQWTAKYGIEPSLPELPFSNNQLFWINLINGPYCYPPSALSIVIDDKYSVYDFSVMRAATSVPEFHKDFNCPVDYSFIKKYGPSCTFFEV
ncbi:neprilysin-2-like [Microplitis mediator]|uniref:neprilysin-2-like n=1 Tax=Microplitis mediator TaxID=375433 RepID=UPI002557810F|nr:neprilysin-2-like [Microplitis mediator]XP_057326564.1 neprilysin-2-like [Microplitis mediator]XP_057326565.1 neprilysin-2-like [Microplitis mediator]